MASMTDINHTKITYVDFIRGKYKNNCFRKVQLA